MCEAVHIELNSYICPKLCLLRWIDVTPMACQTACCHPVYGMGLLTNFMPSFQGLPQKQLYHKLSNISSEKTSCWHTNFIQPQWQFLAKNTLNIFYRPCGTNVDVIGLLTNGRAAFKMKVVLPSVKRLVATLHDIISKIPSSAFQTSYLVRNIDVNVMALYNAIYL